MKKLSLEISGARENNLKDISLSIPHDCFSVITGLSGSGKSSLAFSTVFAEGQQRYIETFSPSFTTAKRVPRTPKATVAALIARPVVLSRFFISKRTVP